MGLGVSSRSEASLGGVLLYPGSLGGCRAQVLAFDYFPFKREWTYFSPLYVY
jgi:hypothetical protein